MSDHTFEAFARRAVQALDRRSAFGVLSGAALAAFGSLAADAKKGKSKKKGKKKKNKKKRKNQACAAGSVGCPPQRCLTAAAECRNAVAQACELLHTNPLDIDVCLAARNACCDLLAVCKDAEANACFEAVNQGG